MNGRIKKSADYSIMALPRIGKVKIGKKSDRGLPMSVDYFIPSGKYAGLFTKAFGERPQTIQVVFPTDDPVQVCDEHYEYRDDEGRLIAKGDGEEFDVWDGEKYCHLTIDKYPTLMDSVQKRYPTKYAQRNGDGWRIRLTLNFFIPMVKGVVGLWTFETNGTASTIPQVRDTFDMMREQRGFVKGIIFDLNVQFASSQKPNSKSRYPVVSLVANESDENIALIKDAYKIKSLNEQNQ